MGIKDSACVVAQLDRYVSVANLVVQFFSFSYQIIGQQSPLESLDPPPHLSESHCEIVKLQQKGNGKHLIFHVRFYNASEEI